MNRQMKWIAAWILSVVLAVSPIQPVVMAAEQGNWQTEGVTSDGCDPEVSPEDEDASVSVQEDPQETALDEMPETENFFGEEAEVLFSEETSETEISADGAEAGEESGADAENTAEDTGEEPVITEEAFSDDGFFGSDYEEKTYQEYHSTIINPLYADVMDASDLSIPVQRFGSSANVLYASGPTYDSLSTASAYVRSQLVKRTKEFTLTVTFVNDIDNTVNQIFNTALTTHTGKPKEGDYLWFQYGGAGVSAAFDSQIATITYSVKYYSTAAQEAAVDTAVSSVLSSLNLSGKSDYEKAKAIYTYICDNVEYDYATLEDESYLLKYTAYAALINKTAVCQGYAVLYYRMALESGLNARVIPGMAGGGGHAWNIVRINQSYYNLDATWDAGCGEEDYYYFLCSDQSFQLDHTRDAIAATSAFYSSYPMSPENYKSCADGEHVAYCRVTKATLSANGKISTICRKCGITMESDQVISYPKTVALSKTSFTYNGKVQKPSVVVKDASGNTIHTDSYTVTWSGASQNAGSYKATVKFKNNYSGTKTLTYTINKRNQTITASNISKVLGTRAFALGAKVTVGNGALSYKSSNSNTVLVSQKGNALVRAVGSAVITISAKATANYNAAVKKITVTCLPKGTVIRSLSNTTGKKAYVTWAKNTAVRGYQIQYGMKSNFSDSQRLTLNSYLKTSALLSGLKKGVWYFRIRTYKVVGGKAYCSPWSAVKKLNITK